MTDAADIIDRIVAGVLEQLHAPSGEAAPANRSTSATSSAVTQFPEAVITAGLLESRGIIAGPMVFAAKAIVTPSAVDYLSSRKIKWAKASNGEAPAADRTTWLVLVSHSTPAVESALDALAPQPGIRWQRELVGCHREAARRAVAALCRGECDGAIAITGKPEALACRANRNANVRGAAVDTVEQAKRLKCAMGANLFAVDPAGQSVFALRSLLREIVSGGKPAVPADWSE
jgi:hypothetical protein